MKNINCPTLIKITDPDPFEISFGGDRVIFKFYKDGRTAVLTEGLEFVDCNSRQVWEAVKRNIPKNWKDDLEANLVAGKYRELGQAFDKRHWEMEKSFQDRLWRQSVIGYLWGILTTPILWAILQVINEYMRWL